MGDTNLSQSVESEGYNIDCGRTWIYPTNYPIREYQYNIVNEALFKNTMVCLPTGLGKTFIAAVVMYNFFRWYPYGKIIFMAPTKPLVKQQMEACYNIMAIPKDATAELTGTTALTSRGDIWHDKRVFFITPQVLQNDIERIAQLGRQIKCLIFDEAHKARGNHAYCEVIKKIKPITMHFRVLALSATPGSTVTDVIKVCNDLLIAHVEIRTEESADVSPYVFKKNIQTVVVPLDGKLRQIQDDYIKVLDKYVRVLVNHRIVYGNCSSLTKGRLFYIKKEYEEKHRHVRGNAHNEIMKNLNICLILYHAYEVLTKHGLRGFLTFFIDHSDKPLLRSNEQIRCIMDDVSNYLGPIPSIDMLPDGSIPDIPAGTKFGHPKFYKLADILLNHFNTHSTSSKVIIFCEYRESVFEAFTILLMHKPLIKPKIFLGQGTITARQQISVVESFRSGSCNTLISTSIGEEGLDIGDVNLVVCFDISNKSSIRMIQRIGRTGRKQDGNVIMLVTEGKEQQLLRDSMAHKTYTTNTLLNSRELTNNLYRNNPRMVPDGIDPKCEKMFITVTKPVQKLKNNNLKSMFENIAQTTADLLSNIPILDFEERIPSSKLLCTLSVPDVFKEGQKGLAYNVEKQRALQSTQGRITSSSNSKMLVTLLELANSMRYNIPLGRCHSLNDKSSSKENFKQSDLRTMFLKQTLTQNTQIYTQEDGGDLDQIVFKELLVELNNFLAKSELQTRDCKICRNLFSCSVHQFNCDNLNLGYWQPPNISVLESLTTEALEAFIAPSEVCISDTDDFNEDDDLFANFDVSDEMLLSPVISKSSCENFNDGNKHTRTNDCNINIECGTSFIGDYVKDVEENLEILRNHKEVAENIVGANKIIEIVGDHSKRMDRSRIIVSDCNDVAYGDNGELANILDMEMSASLSPPRRQFAFNIPKSAQKILQEYKIDDNDYNIQEDKPIDTFHIVENLLQLYRSTLEFFKLKGIDDLFSCPTQNNISQDSEATIICSPDSIIKITDSSRSIQLIESPILSSCSEKLLSKKNKAQKRLFSQSSNNPVHSEIVGNINSGIVTDVGSAFIENANSRIANNKGSNNTKLNIDIDGFVDSSLLDCFLSNEVETNVNLHSMQSKSSSNEFISPGNKFINSPQSKLSSNLQSFPRKSSISHLKSPQEKLSCTNVEYGNKLQLLEQQRQSDPKKLSKGSLCRSDELKLNQSVMKNCKTNEDQAKKHNSQAKCNPKDRIKLVDSDNKQLHEDKPKDLHYDDIFDELILDIIKSPNEKQTSKRKRVHVNSPDLFDDKSSSSSDNSVQSTCSSQIKKKTTPSPIVINDSDEFESPVKILPKKLNTDNDYARATKKFKGNSSTINDRDTKITRNRGVSNCVKLATNINATKGINKLVSSLAKMDANKTISDSSTYTEAVATKILTNHAKTIINITNTKKNHDYSEPMKNMKNFTICNASPVKLKPPSIPNLSPRIECTLSSRKNLSINDICDLSILDLITSNQVENAVPEVQKSHDKRNNSETSMTPNKKTTASQIDESNLLKKFNETTAYASPHKLDSKLHYKATVKKHDKSLSINDICDASLLELFGSTRPHNSNKNDVLEIVESSKTQKSSNDDNCDPSILEIHRPTTSQKQSIDDICDASVLEIFEPPNLQISSINDICDVSVLQIFEPPMSQKSSLEDICDTSNLGIYTNPQNLSKKGTNILDTSIERLLKKYSQSDEDSQKNKQRLKAPCNSPRDDKYLTENSPKTGNQYLKTNHDKTIRNSQSGNRYLKTNDVTDSSSTPGSDKYLTPRKILVSQNKLSTRLKPSALISNIDSDDDFEISPVKQTNPKKVLTSPTVKSNSYLKKRKKNDFIDAEAELSSDVDVSEDERNSSSLDVFDESFVNDETQNMGNMTTMRAHYLQSVRSPVLQRSKFKIAELPRKLNTNIFSQPVQDVDETYCEDSFCVSVGSDSSQGELSELEIAEMLLKEKRRKKSSESKTSKRKRIIELDSDSD